MTTPSPSDPRRLLRDVTDTLRRLRDLAQRLGDSALAAQLDESLERIESQRFTIAVAGEFKRGKSTFVNALLGADVLPADVAPASAALTRVTYGQPAAARIVYRSPDGEPPREETIAIEQLRDFITKLTPESRAVAETVQQAIVSYPSPFCRIHNIDLLDTPGLGDEAAMTAVTAEALQQVDGVIMMVLADSPFGESEGDFLEQLLAQGFSRVLFVVTALDRVEEEDRPAILDLVTRRVNERVARYAGQAFVAGSVEQQALLRRFGAPRVYGISGRQALRARHDRDAALEAASGFKQFFDALERFLTHESESLALQRRVAQIHTAGAVLAERLDARIAGLRQGQSGGSRREAILQSLMIALPRLGDDELRRVAALHDQARTAVAAQLGQLVVTLKARTAQEIAAARVGGEELELQYSTIAGRIAAQLEAGARELVGQALSQIGAQLAALLDPIPQAVRPFAVTLGYALSFAARQSADGPDELQLPPRLARYAAPRPAADSDPAFSGFEVRLTQLAQTTPLPWIERALQSLEVRQALAVPANEDRINRGLRRMALPGKYKQALTAALAQEIDQWQAGAALESASAGVIGAPFAALRQEFGMAIGLVHEQQRVLERERERRAVRLQHELGELTQVRAEIDRLAAHSRTLAEGIDRYSGVGAG